MTQPRVIKERLRAEARRLAYDSLRDQYAKLYMELQFVRTELHNLEVDMLERGEIEEGDIA